MASEPTPEQSYCAGEARRNDWDRFMCVLFAPLETREALFSLIAFNSELARTRDVVSQPLLGQIRLQWWRDALAAIYGDAPPSAATATHPILVPLGRTIADYKLERALLDAMIDARSDELDDNGLTGNVARYVDATAGNLARLQMKVLAQGGQPANGTAAAIEQANMAWGFVELVCRGRIAPDHMVEARELLSAARARTTTVDKRYLPVLLTATLADIHLRKSDVSRVRRQIGLAFNAFRGKF